MTVYWEMIRVRADLVERIRNIAKKKQKRLKLEKSNMQDVIKEALDLLEAKNDAGS